MIRCIKSARSQTFLLYRTSLINLHADFTIETYVSMVKLYVGNSISKLQIQFTTYIFEVSAGNCHR